MKVSKNWKAASKICPNITTMHKRGGGRNQHEFAYLLSPYIYTYIYILHTPLGAAVQIISCIFAETPSNYVKSSQELLNLSNMFKICWKWCLQDPKTIPRLILGTPRAAKYTQVATKGVPWGFKCLTRAPQGNPRAPEDVPRGPWGRPKWSEMIPGVLKGDLAKTRKWNCNIT